jgi:para-nitrobenzyl esterase
MLESWVRSRCLALVGAVAACLVTGACSSSSGAGGSGNGDAGAGAFAVSNAMCMATAKQGALKGKLTGATCEYLGIRYGAPPTGALRFMPPEPAGSWQGTLDATKFGSACEQSSALGMASNGGIASSEDCLFINVFTPQKLTAKPLPVMVFIHGGGFTLGSASQYDGQALSEAGPVVVVTMNYRLGALGFLATPEIDAQRTGAPSGSDGVRDQQLALKWVKDNAQSFGGDASNVTIFGESAGAWSACIHLVSPGSKGLGKQFILESGSCVNSVDIGTRSDRYALSAELVAALCPGVPDGGAGGLACLRAADPKAIMGWVPTSAQLAASMSPTALLGNILGAPFYPIVEGPGGVLPDTPDNIIRAGNHDKAATVVAGTNAHEWGLFGITLASLTGTASLQITTKAQLDQGIQQLYGTTRGAMVQQQYPYTDATAQQVYIDMVTDYVFRCPTRDLARLATAHGTSNFYLYSYEFGRAYHSDEVPALFTVAGLSIVGGTPPTPALAKAMKGYWIETATTGAPNGPATAVTWPSYSTATDQHLVLDDPPKLVAGSHLDQSNCDFWDTFGGFSAQ